ncbi:MAG TPA: TerB family tellurite resistance protein, partial [Vicinamibacteria bacterium]
MLALLRQLLGAPDPHAVPSEEVKERRRRLATGALLVEVARADGHIGVEERQVMQSALETTLGLSREDTLA